MVLTRSLSSGSLGSNRSAGSSVASSCISYKSKSGYGTDPELEDLAEALEKRLRDEGRVKERSSNLLKKKIPNAFVGSEAVTILQELLQAQKDHDRRIALKLPKGSDSEEEDEDEDTKNLPVTREEALDTGRRIATEFGFFKHHASFNLGLKKNLNKEEESIRTAAIKSPLNDSKSDYYQFQNNLPKHVAEMKKKHKTYWDKMRLMEQEIECKDRFYFPRVWPDCFVARDAVDKLMELKLVRSRGEAVHLVRRMNQKVFCCHHVTQEHEFKDDYLFFRFVPKHERMPEPAPKPKKNKPKRSKSPQRKKMAGARKEAQKKIREKRSRSMNHLNNDERAGGAGLSLGTGSLHAPRGTGGGVYASFGTGSSANASPNGSTSDASLSSMGSCGTDSTGDMKSDNTSYGTLSQASAPLLGKDPLMDDSEEEYMESLLMPDESFANANRSSVTKANSTGALGLAAQHKKANKKRANDIRARLARHHKGRIDTINKKKVEMDPDKRASILEEGRKSLEKAKRELILEMPLPYHHKSVVTGKAKKEEVEKDEEKTPEPTEPQQATNDGEATQAECAASTAPAETLAEPADLQQADPEQNEESKNSNAEHQEKKEEEQKEESKSDNHATNDGETAKAECAATTELAETPANSEGQQQQPQLQEESNDDKAEPQPDAVPAQANGADAEGEMAELSGDSSDAKNQSSQESSKDAEPTNADCAPSNTPNETAQHEQQPASELQEEDSDVAKIGQPAGVVAVQDDASEETIADLLGDSSNCDSSNPENASKNDNNFKVVVPSPPRVPVGIDC